MVRRAPSSRTLRPALAVVALAAAIIPALPGGAAQPGSGDVSPSKSSVTYKGSTVTAAPPAVSRRACVDGQNCDSFLLSVEVPGGFYKTNSRILKATITWPAKDNDLDLFVCPGDQVENPQCNDFVGSSTQENTTSESIVLSNPTAGTYRIMAAAAAGATAYTGRISFVTPPALGVVRAASGAFGWVSRPVSPGSAFAEPSVDVDHAGRIYLVAPGGGGVQMWRSFNGGASFDHKEIPSDGGGGDAEIEFLANDTGFTADLRITDSAVSRSTDHFNTWEQQGVGIEQDRQWLAHICNDTVFLGYHDFVLEAELINRSDDGGETWDTVPTPISPNGSAPGDQDEADVLDDQGVNTFSGPVVADQKTKKDVYIVFAISSAAGNIVTGTPPFGEPQQIVVGVSHDAGRTWTLKLVKSGGVGALAGLIFPWITLDRAGNVYVSWAGRDAETEPINVFYAYSTDHGETWSDPIRVNSDATGHAHIYTTVSGGDPGVFAIAWYTASTPDPSSSANDWYVDFAQVRKANTAKPVIMQSRVYPSSIHHGEVCLEGLLCATGGDRSLLDFFQVQLGPDGKAHIAFANNATPDGSLRVWYAQQSVGQSGGNGLHDAAYCEKTPTVKSAGPAGKKAAAKPTPGTGVRDYPLVGWTLLAAAAAIVLGKRAAAQRPPR